eukprot:3390180-Prorocentrum_lima.AAC.1
MEPGPRLCCPIHGPEDHIQQQQGCNELLYVPAPEPLSGAPSAGAVVDIGASHLCGETRHLPLLF